MVETRIRALRSGSHFRGGGQHGCRRVDAIGEGSRAVGDYADELERVLEELGEWESKNFIVVDQD